jgi:ABC-type multidrug transport system fused ATPase/permease subunit
MQSLFAALDGRLGSTRILVLEGGRISEGGSYAELVAPGGGYTTLFELRARRYL